MLKVKLSARTSYKKVNNGGVPFGHINITPQAIPQLSAIHFSLLSPPPPVDFSVLI